MKEPQFTEGPNAGEAQYWRSAPGRKWVDLQQPLDALMHPVAELLLQRAKPAAGEQVLDVGCGAGATSLALAERVAPDGRVLAVDISDQLLAKAVSRRPEQLAETVSFLEADAQTHHFDRGSFDLLFSRFGIMFFSDPIAAFGNLRLALRSGGRLCIGAWASIEKNPWFSIPRDAAVAQLGEPPPASPTAPGPMAFADQDYVLNILSEAGFSDAKAEVVDITVAPPGDVAAVARFACSLGPVARLMNAHSGGAKDAEAIEAAIAKALRVFLVGDVVRLPAAVNVFSATAP